MITAACGWAVVAAGLITLAMIELIKIRCVGRIGWPSVTLGTSQPPDPRAPEDLARVWPANGDTRLHMLIIYGARSRNAT